MPARAVIVRLAVPAEQRLRGRGVRQARHVRRLHAPLQREGLAARLDHAAREERALDG